MLQHKQVVACTYRDDKREVGWTEATVSFERETKCDASRKNGQEEINVEWKDLARGMKEKVVKKYNAKKK